MKYIIESVLQRYQDRQVDLKDPRTRSFLAEEIALVLTEMEQTDLPQRVYESPDYGKTISVTDFGEEPDLEIPEYDPQTGQLNPLYEELTGKKTARAVEHGPT
tara:strand:+ start:2603 stop:2911 length:309 start_codon:yes stop_codon:yes gene_type:complete